MAVIGGAGQIVTEGLIFSGDPANRLSYPGSGITVSNLIGGTTLEITMLNGPVYSASNAGIFTFDGTDDVGRIQPNSQLYFLNKAPFSIELWINVISHTGTGQFRRIINKETAGSPRNGYVTWLWTGDGGSTYQLGFETFGFLDDLTTTNTTGSYWSSIPASQIIGVWNHVVWSYSSSLNETRVNGILRAQGTPGVCNITDTTMPMGICAYLALNSAFTTNRLNARIGNLKFYNKQLTATEVTQNFNALRGRYGV